MKISTIFTPTKYYTKEDTNKLLSDGYYNKTEIDTELLNYAKKGEAGTVDAYTKAETDNKLSEYTKTVDANKYLTDNYYNKISIDTAFAYKDYVDMADNQLAVWIQDKADASSVYTKTETDAKMATKADLVNGKVPVSQLPNGTGGGLGALDTALLTNVYTTTGARNTYTLTIPEVSKMDDLKNKKLAIRLHTDATYGANVTLNVNGLGAFNVSNYDSANTSFRISTLPGYVLDLVWNGTVFVMCDFGSTNQIDGGLVNQVVGGQKTFTKQLETNSNTGVGITNANGYFYTKQASNVTDTVGDSRFYNWDGNAFTQTCTVASPTKGGGTWKTVNQTVSVNQIPFETLYTVTPATPTTISTTAVDLTPIFGAGVKSTNGADLFTYDSVNKVIKFTSQSTDYTNFEIDLRINAIVFGGTNATSQYRFYVARPDGSTSTLPSAQPYIKVSGSANMLVNAQLGTVRVRVNGATDPFVTQGFKIFAIKEVGNDLQLTAGQEQRLLLLR